MIELSLLSNTDRAFIHAWNNEAKINRTAISLIQYIEKQVNNHSEKTAIFYQETSYTYNEINTQANQRAHFIRQQIHGDGNYIVVYMDRSLEAVLCLLAIMKSNNIYVPVDTGMPENLIKGIIEDCQASAILITNKHRVKAHCLVENTNSVVLNLEECHDKLLQMPQSNLYFSKQNVLAYVIYTSGTTGMPKGVKIKHASLINLLLAMQQVIDFRETDNLLAMAPFAFDMSGVEIYLPLLAGGSFFLADNILRFSPDLIIEVMNRYNINVMQATPATWQMLIDAGWKNEQGIKMVCGAEGLQVKLASALYATKAPLWNFYGPTETTIWSTYHKVNEIDDSKPIVSIGKPLANNQLYVLDDNLQQTPIGVPGELYIGGDGIAEGYLNNPVLNSERFIPNKFSGNKGDKLYKTGDMVVLEKTGLLHFMGRIDTQIKVRGHRIEAEVIEKILMEHSDIGQCIVLNNNPLQEQELTAYITLKNDALFLDKVQHYLRDKSLPEYMVPSKFVVVKAFPLTSNGKIDRKAIPKLIDINYLALSDLKSDVSPSYNEYERIIIAHLKDQFKIENLSPDSNFFNIGLHSILLVELARTLSEKLNLPINVIDFFAFPSIKSFANFLMNDESASKDAEINARAEARRLRKPIRRRINNANKCFF